MSGTAKKEVKAHFHCSGAGSTGLEVRAVPHNPSLRPPTIAVAASAFSSYSSASCSLTVEGRVVGVSEGEVLGRSVGWVVGPSVGEMLGGCTVRKAR